MSRAMHTGARHSYANFYYKGELSCMSTSRLNLKIRKLIFRSNLPYRFMRLYGYIPKRNFNTQRHQYNRGKIKTALIVFGIVVTTAGITYAKAIYDFRGSIQEDIKSKAFKSYVRELINPGKIPELDKGPVGKAIDSFFSSR